MNAAIRTGYVHPSLRSNADDLKPLGTGPLPPVITPPMLGAVKSYQALLDLVVTEAPLGGYMDATAMPRLDDAHHALIIRERKDAIDELALPLDTHAMANLFEDRARALNSPASLTRTYFDERVIPLLRRALFWDAQKQLARDEDIRLAGAADARASRFYRGDL